MSGPKSPDGTEFIDQIIISVCRLPDNTLMIYDSQGGALPIDYDRAVLLRDSLSEYLSAGKPLVNSRHKKAIDYLLNPPREDKKVTVPRKGRPGHVYLVECNGAYKIGIAKDLKARISSMQSGSPLPLTLIHSIQTPEMEILEAKLHNHFAHKRFELGEWFDLDTSDVEYIKGLAL